MPTDRKHLGKNGSSWNSDEERFLAKIEKRLLIDSLGECWIWMHSRYEKGYGKFRSGPTMVKAHRWAYEHWIEPIPSGLTIHHKCEQPRCVNPNHLEPKTSEQNYRLGYWGNRTHCKNGHEYTEENTAYRPAKDGKSRRSCRECERRNNRASYHRYRSY
jgi:hypothetical protein